ncbi:MAG: FAD:protein FMN transferase, partial [Desulfovibrio sp.]|nr:FAD:protein FMN transferase [Desulfovibrio sp.]
MKQRDTLSRRLFLQRAFAVGGALAVGLAGGLTPLNALAGPAGKATAQQTRLLMGCFVTLTAVTRETSRAEDAFGAAFAEMERLIAVFDRHSATSALAVLNAQGRLAGSPPELVKVLAASQRLGVASEHAFNPAITPALDLLEASQAKIGGPLPGYADNDYRHALSLASPGGVRLDGGTIAFERSGMKLTLDGIAKGFIADRASEVLAAFGLADHMVNAGGDIRCSGRAARGENWTIGIRHPAGGTLASTAMGDGGIATSGSYESFYGRSGSRHHLISHLTGKSADVLSVTVKAGTAMRADALATALAFMPP